MKYRALALAMAISTSACSADNRPESASTVGETNSVKIQVTINGKAITATLVDNPTSRDFITLLPLTVKLDDYASTEKITYLPRRLSTEGAPVGVDPDVGDITYYAPWGNLAIFYRDFGYSVGLIKLGRFDGAVDALKVRGSLNVTIEAVGR